MEGLEIRLLGPSRFLVDGAEVEEERWQRSRAKSLVKMLALEPDRRLHREIVMERFWPDLEPSRSANNLHKAIHAARRALEPDLTPRGRSRFLQSRGQHVFLTDVSAVDAEAFARATALADASPSAERVEAALALYAGNLLADELYESWAAEPRERCAAAHRRLLRLAADLYEARGDLERAAEALQSLLAGDALDERLHRRLMDLYVRAGRRGRAVRQFLVCREALARELGAEPERETVELYETITSGGDGGPAPQPGRDNLPTRATRFLGREREIEAVGELLARTRLLTLTGPGGIGKTRLALEVARGLVGAYPDGVWLVELAPIADGALVPRAVARALEAVDDETDERLLARLRSRRLLLVLDNCEHLVEASAAFADRLLRAAGGVTVLATSREALGVEGEAVWPVPPLVQPTDAVRLFVDRARLLVPDFAAAGANADTVAEICRRLDGLPLAIELAARCTGLLSPAQILDRLRDRFALLQGPPRAAEPRHRSLRATLDWSYDSLAEREEALLRCLTVFRGSFDIAAAESICSAECSVLSAESSEPSSTQHSALSTQHVRGTQHSPVLELVGRLVDTSLLVVERPAAGGVDEVRYRMLETIREYGAEKLREAGEERRLGSALLGYYAGLVEAAADEFPGPDERAWVRRMRLESDNLRAAMEVAVAYGDDDLALRLAGGLGQFWSVYGFLRETRAQIEAILERTAAIADRRRARALYALGMLRRRQGDLAAAVAAFAESCDVARSAWDRRRLARALTALAALVPDGRDAERLLDEAEALFPAPEEEDERTRAAFARGLLAMRDGDVARACEQFGRSLALFRRLRSPGGIMVALHNLGEAELRLGLVDVAEAHLLESLGIAGELGERRVTADTYVVLGELAFAAGRERQGVERARHAAEHYAAEGFERGVAVAIESLAGHERAAGRTERALSLTDTASAVRDGAMAFDEAIARAFGGGE